MGGCRRKYLSRKERERGGKEGGQRSYTCEAKKNMNRVKTKRRKVHAKHKQNCARVFLSLSLAFGVNLEMGQSRRSSLSICGSAVVVVVVEKMPPFARFP